MLYGASGATRKGTLKGGKWHGEATYTTQVSDQFIIFCELCGIFSGWRNQERALGQWPASLGPGEVSDNTHYPVAILIISLALVTIHVVSAAEPRGGTFSEKTIVCHWWKILSTKISANSEQICFQKRFLLAAQQQKQHGSSLVLAMSLGLSYSHRWTQSALTNLIIKTRLTRMKKTLTSQMFIL